jgi:hypothetical protein
MATTEFNDLSELVDDPVEREAVEYKVSLDLTDPAAKAKLARHIAALANFGGGKIVLGFNDDLTPSDSPPPPINRDTVASIVKAYLEPTFQCDVRSVSSRSGRSYPVIIIPSHGSVPICARADGPQIDKKVQGIQRGTYYLRKPGPASEAILTAAEWAPVIRRCALFDRVSILGALQTALAGAQPTVSLQQKLEAWHAAAAAAYQRDLAQYGDPKNAAERHFHFSYLIDPIDDGPSANDLLRELERANTQVDAEIYDGWGMFHIFHGKGGASFRTDKALDGGEQEFVETNFIRDGSNVGATDLWRVASTGMATLLRGYFEDSSGNRPGGYVVGKSFSPNWLVQNVAELVAHANALSAAYPRSALVIFRCEWVGLAGRSIHDPYHGRWFQAGQPAEEDHRVSTATFSVGELSADRFRVIEKLVGPVARAFGIGPTLSAEWIAGQAPTWKRV